VFRQPLEKLFKEHPVYVFGYGSLLYSQGWIRRRMIVPPKADDLIECDLKNYERGPWGMFSLTNYYGIIRKKGAACNGVLARVHDLQDWVELMATEAIAGLFRTANYRVVDVTKSIKKCKDLVGKDAVIHAVCNRPVNRRKFPHTYPQYGYYDRVWAGINNERGTKFANRFLKTGGFKCDQQVEALAFSKRPMKGDHHGIRNQGRYGSRIHGKV